MTPVAASPGVPISFVNASTGANSFLWTFGDNSSSAEHSPEHAYQTQGMFEVKLVAGNLAACMNSATAQVLISAPSPDVSVVGITTADNPDGTIRVVITLSNNGNTLLENVPVTIDVSGNLNLQGLIDTPLPPLGRYNLQLGYGLRRSDDLLFICADAHLAGDVNLANNRSCAQFENQLFVLPAYPNPVSNYLTVEWVANKEEEVTISLSSAIGGSMTWETFNSSKGYNQRVLSVADLQKGVYILTIQGNNLRSVQRILIAN
ncbi:MAG TPA: T9SS type A sorting domain-containing protein, partial [Chryseosolibacter sp.]|nr:T9SS type A sorting domain-containing protein [Chryseosolibacter sp.]